MATGEASRTMAEGAAGQRGSLLVSAATRVPALAVPILIAASLALFVPGITVLPPIDRDEARFVQATKQMHETGDYLDIRFQDEPRHNKPIGIHWLQALATAPAAGEDALMPAYRLPSLAGAVIAVLACWAAGLTLFGARAAFLGALLLAATILLGVEARLAKTDAVLLAATCLAQAVLARAWMTGREAREGTPEEPAYYPPLSWPACLLFWAALALGILVKGPIILMVLGLTIVSLAAFARSLAFVRRLRPLSGAGLAIALCAPWYVLIGVESGGMFFREAFARDLLAKLVAGVESHGAPPGTYLALLPATFWPLAPFALLAAPLMTGAWRRPESFFCLAWAVPSWLAFEAAATKLPHYVLPLVPAVALLAGAAMARGAALAHPSLARAAAILLLIIPVAVAAAAAGSMLVLNRRIEPGADVALVLALVAAGIASRQVWKGRAEHGAVTATVGAALLGVGVHQFTLPALDAIWVSPRAVAAARASAGCPDPTLGAAGYTEPSLVVLAGTGTLLGSPEEIAEWIKPQGCRVALVEARQDPAFRQAAAGQGIALREVGAVEGFNYSRGQPVVVRVYRRAGEAS